MKSRRRKRAVRRAAHINAAPADGGTNSESAAPLAGDASVVLARGLFLTTGGPHDPAVSRVPSPAPAARDRAKRREPEHQHGQMETGARFEVAVERAVPDAVAYFHNTFFLRSTPVRVLRAHILLAYISHLPALAPARSAGNTHTRHACARPGRLRLLAARAQVHTATYTHRITSALSFRSPRTQYLRPR